MEENPERKEDRRKNGDKERGRRDGEWKRKRKIGRMTRGVRGVAEG
jgi:hypothetical protein